MPIAGRQLGARDRRAEQRLGGAAAVLVIVVGLPVGGGVAEIGLGLAAQGQLRIVQNLALFRRAGQRRAVEHLEGVGSLHLPLEVDVVGEYAGQLGDDVVGNAVILGGRIEARADMRLGVEVVGGRVTRDPAFLTALDTGCEMSILVCFDDDRSPSGPA